MVCSPSGPRTTSRALRPEQGHDRSLCRRHGCGGKNFYNTLFTRYGYEAEAKEIQDLYLDGKKAQAAAAIPDSFLMETSLVGEKGFVREQIEKFKAAGVTTLNVAPVAADLKGQQDLIAKTKELAG
ncbi:MAG: LLM class flavin-dependent oxidoreductase [Microthrixaceae bacterium]